MLITALLFASPIARCAEGKAPERPNIVPVIADDRGYSELDCFGGKDVPTPQIDSLAHRGHFEPDYAADNPVLRSSQPTDEKANLTGAFTREVVDFISRHRAHPFVH